MGVTVRPLIFRAIFQNDWFGRPYSQSPCHRVFSTAFPILDRRGQHLGQDLRIASRIENASSDLDAAKRQNAALRSAKCFPPSGARLLRAATFSAKAAGRFDEIGGGGSVETGLAVSFSFAFRTIPNGQSGHSAISTAEVTA